MVSRIPKKIHYCWFGGNPIPAEYQRYIDSWRKYMPDYEIVEWNEQNYDVNCIPFSAEAYEKSKYAYVSDYARLRILYEHGGIYLDTDVELLKPLDDILAQGGFMGFEKNTNAQKGEMLKIALGLGFAVPPRHPIIREIMDYYETRHYCNPDGSENQVTIVVITTDILKRWGLSQSDTPTTIEGITFYPWDYFCPMEFMGRKMEMTPNTYSIHHFSASWLSWWQKMKIRRGYYIGKIKKHLRRWR